MLRYFDISEFVCSESNDCYMQDSFLESLDLLRGVCGFPFVVTSGYRNPFHSVEIVKSKPGTHTQGIAADIAVTNSRDRYTLINNAVRYGFKGIGIAKTFIHLDMRETSNPVMWVY